MTVLLLSYNLGLKQTALFVQAVGVPGVWGSQISRKSIYESDKVVIPVHWPPLGIWY